MEASLAAVLFADIVGSTRLYEKLGDHEGRELVGRTLARLGAITGEYDGVVVKTIGDEVLCTFPDAPAAVRAAMSMNVSLRDDPPAGAAHPHIRTGIHFGSVVREDDDVFGDTVNQAARLVALALPDRIVVSDGVRETLPADLSSRLRPYDETTLKGISGVMRLHEVVWEEDVVTFVARGAPAFRIRAAELTIGNGSVTVVVGPTRSSATAGRLDHNDLVVDDPLVSRTHVRFEYRRGRFVLVDLSSNGTYVAAQGGKMVRVSRQEQILDGEGLLGLGREPGTEGPGTLTFRVTHPDMPGFGESTSARRGEGGAAESADGETTP